MTISYQIGVDVLGFPIYTEHPIFYGKTKARFNRKNKEWVSIIQKCIKQN